MKFDRLFKTGVIGNLMALLAGAMLTLAFAPFSAFPLAIFSPAVLLALWLTVTPKKAFIRGFLYGLGLFGTGVYWIYISIHTYGEASVFLAGLITFIFVSLLALFPAFTGYLLNRYFSVNNDSKLLFAFPAIWVLFEWLRSWLLSGFPWLYLGSSQINSPLKGYAPLLSVYGVSLAVLLSASLLVSIFWKIRQKNYKTSFKHAGILLAIWIIGSFLCFKTWTEPTGKPIQVSLVQGNIEQNLKWSYDQIIPTLNHYQRLTDANWGSKIIVWPEAAIPISLQNAQSFLETLADDAKEHQATVITGIPAKHGTDNTYYNAIVAVGSDYSYYLKRRLVPFGEYTPMPQLLTKVMTHFNIPMSDMVGDEAPAKPLFVQGLKIAAFICYEIAFPEQVNQRDSDVSLLLTVSNDGWFGRSIALAQHLEMAQMRALELGRPLLFVSNTGITAVIKPDGNIQSSVPPYQSVVLTDLVQPMTGKTPWQKRGMDGVLLIAITFLLSAILNRKQNTLAS